MANENVNKRVVGFSVNKHDMYYLNGLSPNYLYGLSPKHLYELACEDLDAIIYDSADAFFADINCNLIDIKNNFWFFV